jgi:hypothetical protein
MKKLLRPSGLPDDVGSVLVAALLMAIILGFTLGSYLLWVSSQNVLTRESHAWNAALVVAEAGIEEGMAQINTPFGTNNHLEANNWGVIVESGLGRSIYGPPGTRDLIAAGVNNGKYGVVITRRASENGNNPIVYSIGQTMVPLIGTPIERIIRVETALTPAFPGGMAALLNISFKGNNIWIDSYDSMDTNYSTPSGMYDPLKRKAGGDVASVNGIIEVGNANINGKVRTGPDGGYTMGPNGFAGDLNFHGPGIQTGWYANDFNADFKNAALPDDFSATAPPPPVDTTPGSTNLYIMTAGDYKHIGKLEAKAKQNVLIAYTPSGSTRVRLWVTGEVLMQGQSTITIEYPMTFEIYVSGASAAFTAVNTTGNANSFQYYGLPTNTSMSWSGNETYVGCVYAPQAIFTCGGGGSTIYDYQGACVVKSVNMNGHFKFHYDEGLRRRGPPTGYHANSWRELSKSELSNLGLTIAFP